MPDTLPLIETPSWQESLASIITDPRELLEMLGLSPEQAGFSEQALAGFSLKVPRPYAARIRPGEPDDPLLLQVLPHREEMHDRPGFVTDPLAESGTNPHPGILHKYHGRALLMPSTSCAIHCRYCFRRHFPYDENRPGRAQWQAGLDYLAADTAVTEVILSGGDPLAVSDKQLGWLLERLAEIPRIRRIRIHTRLPIMIPQRISENLCRLLSGHPARIVVVLHANHARELDEAVANACARLTRAGIMLLNQSVLLRGINDDAHALAALSERLFEIGTLPYYLHMLDRVSGTAHFEVSEPRALELMAALRASLPGYLVPRLVREEAGRDAKTPLA